VKKYVMDSFAMMVFFEDEPGDDEEGVKTAEKVIEQLRKYPIELVDADLKLTYVAAKLKARYMIAYADCLAAGPFTQTKRSNSCW